MATQKQVRILYQAKGNKTGLTDVKAQAYLNGVAKAVGINALTLNEVDAVNSPGIYELVIAAATLTSWGVTNSQYQALELVIDSVSQPAKASWRGELTVASNDDLDLKLDTIVTSISTLQTSVDAIKTDLETGTYSLQNILTAVQAIQNNAGFSVPVPATLLIPGVGSNAYRIPFTVYNEKNNLIDPDSNSVVVTLVNQAGVDRSAYLTGNSGGSAPAVRDSLGQYHIDLSIPNTAPEEELIFNFAYAIGGIATARKCVSETITDVSAEGFALQSTLTTVKTEVEDVQAKVNNATYGLAALKTSQDAIASSVSEGKGVGFVAGTDDLHALSVFLRESIFVGGKAV